MKKTIWTLIFVFVVMSAAFVLDYSRARSAWRMSSKTKVGATLEEITWTTCRAVKAKYAKVGIRLLALKDNPNREGVVVYLPPAGTSARVYTESENYDFRIYLARRGYEVFSIDYRINFIPEGEKDLSLLAGFTTDVTLNDIHEAIQQVRSVTGAKKVILVGHGTGARYAYLYAASRWLDELAGMVVMDGAPWQRTGAPSAVSSIDIRKAYSALKEGDKPENRKLFQDWGLTPSSSYYDVKMLSLEPAFYDAVKIYYEKGEKAPSPVKGFDTVADYIGNRLHFAWGRRQLTNVRNGSARVDVLLDFILKAGMKNWPLVDQAEDAYIGNWNGIPPEETLQLTKGMEAVNIPILVFSSSEFTDANGMKNDWKRAGYNMIKSKDRQYVVLNGFGHLDVLLGEQARNQVYFTIYNWLKTKETL